MSTEDALMTMHRQLDADAGPYVRLARSRKEPIEVVFYVDASGKVNSTVKAKPGKKPAECA